MNRLDSRLPAVFAGDTTRKIGFFGVVAAIGCLVGALLGEPLFAFLPRAQDEKPQVDVLFVLDVTGSMQDQIDGVRSGIVDFAAKLSERGLDERVGIVAFRDEMNDEPAEVLDFGNGTFTKDYDTFRARMDRLIADGGGDNDESSYDALRLAAIQPFRARATRALILITDAAPHLPDRKTRSLDEVVSELSQRGIHQLHAVINMVDRDQYAVLQARCPGEIFDLATISRGGRNFDALLPVLGERIAEATIRGLASSSAVTSEYAPRQVLVTALWTGLLSAGLALALVAGQNHYLRKPAFRGSQPLVAAALGMIIGVLAGGLAQVIGLAPQFLATANRSPSFELLVSGIGLVGTVFGWLLLGGLVGRGLAFFVPNLRPDAAIVGGVIGGLAAAAGFAGVSSAVGDSLGRLIGAAVLGFCIGIMIAIAEAAVRTLFLEVRYGAKEVVRVSLGATPVTVGADGRASTVFVATSPRPVMYKYWSAEDGLRLLDFASERTYVIGPGDERKLGNVTLTVRAGGATSDTPTTASTRSPSAPPPPPAPARGTPSQVRPNLGISTVPAPPPSDAAKLGSAVGDRRLRPAPPPPPPPPGGAR